MTGCLRTISGDKMKKIIINGMEIFGDKEPHGPQRYGIEVAHGLDTVSKKGEIEILIPNAIINNVNRYKWNNIKIRAVEYDMSKYKARFRFSKFYFARYVKKHDAVGVDLVLSYPVNGCNYVTVFDCITKENKEKYKDFKDFLFCEKFLMLEHIAIKNAKKIFTISDISKKAIINNYKVKKPIIIAPAAWQHMLEKRLDDSVLERYSLKRKKYLFSAGVGLKRKNFKWINEAAWQNPDFIFVVSGANVNDNFFGEKGKPKNLIQTGFVSDEEYVALLSNAKAYIQPSLHEGFGIPPLEALGCGTEIIVSDIPIFREIYENSAHYINPYAYDNINVNQIMKSEVCNPEKILEKYSWTKTAEIIYKEIMGDNN